jgi:hypothetical protein
LDGLRELVSKLLAMAEEYHAKAQSLRNGYRRSR